MTKTEVRSNPENPRRKVRSNYRLIREETRVDKPERRTGTENVNRLPDFRVSQTS